MPLGRWPPFYSPAPRLAYTNAYHPRDTVGGVSRYRLRSLLPPSVVKGEGGGLWRPAGVVAGWASVGLVGVQQCAATRPMSGPCDVVIWVDFAQ